AATARLVPEAAAALGLPLDVLVNNASIFERDTIATATWESWDRHLGSNLRAPFELIQAFAAQAPKAGRDALGEPVARAAVVNIVDQRVRKVTPEFTTYTVAKLGLWALTRIAAQALAPDVRVNAIGPGPMLRGLRQSPGHFAAQRAATVLARGAGPDELCAALRFLLDAPGVTGQLICVDGGQHLVWRTADILGVE
ncbi:MAG: SDR family oxidoreductase, partial [Rhodobacteraceae bacterium]|nr:SDR family oxidoreductase [Paracoccaceae bacterium]